MSIVRLCVVCFFCSAWIAGGRASGQTPSSRPPAALASFHQPPARPFLPEDYAPSASEDEEEENQHLLGDWIHGSDGLSFECIYTGDVFNNMKGGIRTTDATRYCGLLDIAALADTEKLWGQNWGKFFLFFQNLQGQGLSEDFVGDFQVYDNIDFSPTFTQVSEYWWEHTLFDDSLTVRLGKQDVNSEFAIVDLGGDFLNSSFGYPPNVPMPTYPLPGLGALVKYQLDDTYSIKGGVYNGDPQLGSWGANGDGTTFSIAELKAEYDLFGAYHGDWHVGAWYHSGAFDRFTGPPTHQGNHGIYCGADQVLFREDICDEENNQGLGAFLQFAWAPEVYNEAEIYHGAGLVYTGPIDGRDEDVLGLGVARVVFSKQSPVGPDETAIELFYRAQITPWMTVQPDTQYIVRPGGQYPDAWVIGLRSIILL